MSSQEQQASEQYHSSATKVTWGIIGAWLATFIIGGCIWLYCRSVERRIKERKEAERAKKAPESATNNLYTASDTHLVGSIDTTPAAAQSKSSLSHPWTDDHYGPYDSAGKGYSGEV